MASLPISRFPRDRGGGAGRSVTDVHEGLQWGNRLALRQARAIARVTPAGCPALAAPAGFSAGGLPIGLQIVAPVHGELSCLQLAAAFEQANRANRANVARRSPLSRGV